jgi:hypothetical protein
VQKTSYKQVVTKPNNRLQPTPYSLRFAPASRRG